MYSYRDIHTYYGYDTVNSTNHSPTSEVNSLLAGEEIPRLFLLLIYISFSLFLLRVVVLIGSCPDDVDFFNLSNPSSRTMALGSTQPLTEMSARNLPGG
jgi:hypothetical protein